MPPDIQTLKFILLLLALAAGMAALGFERGDPNVGSTLAVGSPPCALLYGDWPAHYDCLPTDGCYK